VSAEDDIRALLQAYFDGLYHSDARRLAGVFHPRAVYATADEERLLVRDMDDYFEVIAQRPSPASRAEPRRDAIDSIDLAGSNTALARVRCAIGRRDFTDYLSLVRENGRWLIMAKVFAISETPEE